MNDPINDRKLNDRTQKSMAQLVLKTVLQAGFFPILLFAQADLVQSQTPQPLEDFKPQELNRGDIFSNSGSGQSSAAMDLIHRATLGTVRPLSEYRLEQQKNITDAATDFRARQLEAIRAQQKNQSAGSVTPGNSTVPASDSKAP